MLTSLAITNYRSLLNIVIPLGSHANRVIATLGKNPDCHFVRLEKTFGETKVVGQELSALEAKSNR